MFDVMKISSSALTAQRTRMDVIARNIANMDTTRDAAGRPNPYRRQEVLFKVGMPDAPKSGVHVAAIVSDSSPFRIVQDPGNPDADADGMVRYPNVDLQREVVDAILAQRAYEANIAAYEVSKNMLAYSLRLLG